MNSRRLMGLPSGRDSGRAKAITFRANGGERRLHRASCAVPANLLLAAVTVTIFGLLLLVIAMLDDRAIHVTFDAARGGYIACPSSTKRLRTAASLRAWTTAALSLPMTSRGVLLGAQIAFQDDR